MVVAYVMLPSLVLLVAATGPIYCETECGFRTYTRREKAFVVLCVAADLLATYLFILLSD